MTTSAVPSYAGYRFPAEVISHAVWLYFRFPLSLSFLLDTHDRAVAPAVWSLFETALSVIGPRPTLIEWDAAIPALPVLLSEAAQAQCSLARRASGGRDVLAA